MMFIGRLLRGSEIKLKVKREKCEVKSGRILTVQVQFSKFILIVRR